VTGRQTVKGVAPRIFQFENLKRRCLTEDIAFTEPAGSALRGDGKPVQIDKDFSGSIPFIRDVAGKAPCDLGGTAAARQSEA
jgi:hypothetical protein